LKLLLLFISSKKQKSIEFGIWEKLSSKLSLFKHVERINHDDPWSICENRIINFALQEKFLNKYQFKYRGSVATISLSITEKGEKEVEKLFKSLE